MKLQQTDWNHPSGATLVDVHVPDELVQPFLNWLWTTKQWYENPEVVYRKFMQMQEGVLAWLTKHPKGLAPEPPTPVTVQAWMDEQLANPVFRTKVEETLKQMRLAQARTNRLAALQKAREARAAQRQTVAAG